MSYYINIWMIFFRFSPGSVAPGSGACPGSLRRRRLRPPPRQGPRHSAHRQLPRLLRRRLPLQICLKALISSDQPPRLSIYLQPRIQMFETGLLIHDGFCLKKFLSPTVVVELLNESFYFQYTVFKNLKWTGSSVSCRHSICLPLMQEVFTNVPQCQRYKCQIFYWTCLNVLLSIVRK